MGQLHGGLITVSGLAPIAPPFNRTSLRSSRRCGDRHVVTVAGVDAEDDSINLRAVSRYDYKLSETAKIWETIEYLPEFEDFGVYLINYELGVEAALNSRFNLRLVFEDKYDSDPAPGIEKNDVIIKSALVCNL